MRIFSENRHEVLCRLGRHMLKIIVIFGLNYDFLICHTSILCHFEAYFETQIWYFLHFRWTVFLRNFGPKIIRHLHRQVQTWPVDKNRRHQRPIFKNHEKRYFLMKIIAKIGHFSTSIVITCHKLFVNVISLCTKKVSPLPYVFACDTLVTCLWHLCFC